MRRIAIIVTVSLAGFAGATEDHAAAQSCFTLQAELQHLQSRGGGGRDRNRYQRAYREQANVLARAERRAREAGCFGGGFFLFQPKRDRSCNQQVAKIRDMQQNLGRLDRLRRRGGGGNERRIRQIRRAMAARGCDRPGSPNYVTRRGSVFDDTQRYAPRGTYRTLCVRTCDGYYFPISFSTTPDRFPDDARTCDAMCPATESRLYYYANPGGRPEEMMSVTGEAYASLPTAFQYRTALDSACSCRPAGGYAATAAAQSPARYIAAEPTAPPPKPRPAPGEDPETLANRAGDFVPQALTRDSAAMAAAPAPSSDGVRIVGPAYLIAPQQDDVMLNPIPN